MMKPRTLILPLSLLIAIVSFSSLAFAQSGGLFDLNWFTIDGGGGNSGGGPFALSGTLGQADAGVMAGGDFSLNGGFWDGAPAVQIIGIDSGWNMISSYLSPTSPALDVIFPPSGEILLCKDDAGNVYWPDIAVNQIGSWHAAKGYQCYAASPISVTLAGTMIPGGTAMDLPQGWSMIAYWRDSPQTAGSSLASCNSSLILAKNGKGEVFWPDYGVNQIGDLLPGQGYQLFLDAPCTLIYPEN